MTSEQLTMGPRSAEIVAGDVSGGPNTSHTIVVGALGALLDAVPGESPGVIADQLGVELRTVYLWFSDALVKRELERRSLQFADVMVSRLADHALAAMDHLRAVVELPLEHDTLTPEQKLAAIREILDRCPRTRIVT